MSADGCVRDWNPAAEKAFGFSYEEAVGRELAELIVPPELREAHRSALKRYLASRRPTILDRRLQLVGRRADDAEFPVELTVTRVPDVEPPLFAGFLRDLTDQRDAERQRDLERTRLRFLADASAVLDASLALDETLRGLAQLAVPELGDWCSVDLAVEGEGLRNVAVAHTDRGSLAAGVPRPPDEAREDDHVGSPAVVRSGRSELHTGIPGERLITAAESDEQLELLRALGFVSAMVVPLAARGRTLGTITLMTARPGRRYGAADLAFAEDLGRRAAVAIDNARLYERERRIAEELQRSFLPDQLPAVPRATVAARYRPAALDAEVGGDWYDVIPLPDGRVGLAIGDVVGHGIKAAAIMGQLRSALRAYALEGHGPSGVVERLKAMLVATGEGGMVGTLLFLVFEPVTGELSYCSAGHVPAIVRHPGARTEYLDAARTTPLGVSSGAVGEARAQLAAGSMLVLYTDGLVERRRQDLAGGFTRLARAVAEGPEEPEPLLDALLSALLGDEPAADDVALLALRPVGHRADPLRVELPAARPSVTAARRTVARWLQAAGANREEAYELTVALADACANAVEHAYGPGDASFEIDAQVVEGEVVIEVRDSGGWREPRGANRGRGLRLMDAFTDSLAIDAAGSGTTVRLRRRLAGGR